jgi:hypothetical protein
MRVAAFAFASDLVHEGVETVLDNLQRRGGLDGVTLAAAYHAARDVHPHDPVRRVGFTEGGQVYFRPDPARWRDSPIAPRPSALVADRDPLADAVAAAGRRGLDVRAWTVFLHVDWTSDGDPAVAERNAFGDAYLTQLCPANPAVRAYARALAADVASRGVEAVLAESLHYHPLEHGYHHERYFVQLPASARLYLSLCFCEHCLAAAAARGADGAALRRAAAAEVQAALDRLDGPAGEPDLDREAAGALLGGELAALLDARCAVVAGLTAEVADACREAGSRLVQMDASGAVKGYADGRPTGGAAPEIAWRLGVDVAAVARACDGLEAIAYAADPARVELDLRAYGALAGAGRALAAALRPMAPDCDSAANLAAKLRLAESLGLERVDLYHYGLAPLAALDRTREARALAAG